jgi:hypothetical protein
MEFTRVIAKNGSKKFVKNLGWLLRNSKLVSRLEVRKAAEISGFEAVLVAQLTDGRIFEALFASLEVLERWLKRPIFLGVSLNWLGVQTVVTKKVGKS